ncbi:MAG: hypothetical protein ABIE03_07160 [Patescibacteria group bacterium]|nr:hypothetical protein [Patescibacteria group bacterium]
MNQETGLRFVTPEGAGVDTAVTPAMFQQVETAFAQAGQGAGFRARLAAGANLVRGFFDAGPGNRMKYLRQVREARGLKNDGVRLEAVQEEAAAIPEVPVAVAAAVEVKEVTARRVTSLEVVRSITEQVYVDFRTGAEVTIRQVQEAFRFTQQDIVDVATGRMALVYAAA